MERQMATKTFEQAMEELENIVDALEKGDLTLEQTIKKFERGMELSKFCSEKLTEVELKLKKLVKTENGFQLEIM
ncbi:MAG TPA: exodeoxyribonuclease VII small subunit [bacterium]|nr:exodeoxyribonuclease VII small subunit [bacterium]